MPQPVTLAVVVHPDTDATVLTALAGLTTAHQIVTSAKRELKGVTAKYVAFIDNELPVPQAFDALVASLEATGSDFATGTAELLKDGERTDLWEYARGGYAEDVFAAGAAHTTLDEHPEALLDQALGNKVLRADFARALEPEKDLVVARLYCAAGSFDVLPRTACLLRSASKPGGADHSLVAAMSADGGWASQGEAAVEYLVGHFGADPAKLSRYALHLLRQIVIRYGQPNTATTGVAQLVNQLLPLATIADLRFFPTFDRWKLAVLALGLPELIEWIAGRWTFAAPTPERATLALLDGREAELPADFAATLGLGGRTLTTAFTDCFAPAARPRITGTPPVADPPLLSVVIPVHNVEDFLDELLRSLQAPTEVPIEFIIVDDASTDGTFAVLERYAATDPRFVIVKNPGRGGGQARNVGVELARGEYLAFADGDDIVPPGAFDRLIAEAQASGADIVTAGFRAFNAHDTISYDNKSRYGRGESLRGITLADLQLLFTRRAVWSRVYRRDFWLANALPYPSVSRTNDIVTVMGVLAAAKSMSVIPDCLYLYRIRPGDGSMSSQARQGKGSSLTVSNLFQEVTSARVISALGHPKALDRYWRGVLASAGWHLARHLEHNIEDELPESGLYQLRQILDSAPGWSLRSMPAPRQSMWALLEAGEPELALAALRTEEGEEPEAAAAEKAYGLLRASKYVSATAVAEMGYRLGLTADPVAPLVAAANAAAAPPPPSLARRLARKIRSRLIGKK
ncbi:MAG: glycosyltransferase [Propionibacteriaceae bacterium]|nr:glycosyltransferase [Propionibacteriaceae bacterium]